MTPTEQKSIYQEEKKIIIHSIHEAIDRGNSFSLWRSPGVDKKHLIISTTGVKKLDELTFEDAEPGFVFSPFSPDQKKIFFPADLLYTFENGFLIDGVVNSEWDSESKVVTHSHYLPVENNGSAPDFQKLVERGVASINSGALEKIVPARFKDITRNENFDLLNVFHQLCEKHPLAFVSLVSSPETGTWMGATPELLVSVAQNKFKTVALAGTLPYSPDINLKSVAWTQKEIEEQALVCRYIINCFKKIRLREYEEHGPKTTVAGNLMHLKTEYEVDTLATNFPQLGSVMLKLLHPTSAVSGMPLENALTFLKAYEGFNRQFYSGYLGPVNLKTESHIYVNLRCMQVFSDKVRIYAGAGVTADSVSETEWMETEMKMQTLQKIITQ
ncbi:MAG: chorismate-binding protein [Cyclobacteriaceae bacterium]|nr:chorismate-binding protein [Cyclobacteriaceae bacterium]